MPVLAAILENMLFPYWDSMRKSLTQRGISSLGITIAPNIVGHPVGVITLLALGLFTLPGNPSFYLFWSGVVVIGAVTHILGLWGLRDGSFFAFEVLSKLTFLTTSIAGVIFLGEHLSSVQVFALVLATIGALAFALPHRRPNRKFVWDKSIAFVILGLLIGSASSVFYKMAATSLGSFTEFVTGRFVADLVLWTAIWLIGVHIFNKRNPITEMEGVLTSKDGSRLAFGAAATNLLSAWIIFHLPISTFAMIGTLGIPIAYLWSHYRYQEKLTWIVGFGTACILIAIFLFLMF